MSKDSAAAASRVRHRMSDWLKLHCFDATRCSAILDRAASVAVPVSREGRVIGAAPLASPLTAEQAWGLAVDGMSRRSPALGRLAAVAGETARTNFEPDKARFPRAFTLHDEGTGRPYVSCPYDGRAGDLMAVAHEFGHALQIIATGGTQLSPVLREVCAFLGELSLLSALQRDRPELFPSAEAIWQLGSQKQFTSGLTKLNLALRANDPPYSYRWNYPVARILAIEADRHLSGEEFLRLYQGQLSAPQLCGLLVL